MSRLAVGLIALVAAAGAVRWALGRWSAVTISGDSMAPALADGDRLLVQRRPARRLTVGDVVVAWTPGIPHTLEHHPRDRPWLVKRVAAIPGDPVPAPVAAAVGGDRQVPPGRLILLGDNTDGVDSRQLGYFDCELVLGVVVRRLGSV